MNKLELIGNLTTDPVMKTVMIKDTPTKVTNFSIAVNERKRADSTDKPEPVYFRCHVWRGLAETCAEYLRKGRKVWISGPVKMNSYKDSSGAIRYAMDVRIDDIEFLDSKQPAGQMETTQEEDLETLSEAEFPCG